METTKQRNVLSSTPHLGIDRNHPFESITFYILKQVTDSVEQLALPVQAT